MVHERLGMCGRAGGTSYFVNGLELEIVGSSGLHCLLTGLTMCRWLHVAEPLAPYGITPGGCVVGKVVDRACHWYWFTPSCRWLNIDRIARNSSSAKIFREKKGFGDESYGPLKRGFLLR